MSITVEIQFKLSYLFMIFPSNSMFTFNEKWNKKSSINFHWTTLTKNYRNHFIETKNEEINIGEQRMEKQWNWPKEMHTQCTLWLKAFGQINESKPRAKTVRAGEENKQMLKRFDSWGLIVQFHLLDCSTNVLYANNDCGGQVHVDIQFAFIDLNPIYRLHFLIWISSKNVI